jgi:hypothetical protein
LRTSGEEVTMIDPVEIRESKQLNNDLYVDTYVVCTTLFNRKN